MAATHPYNHTVLSHWESFIGKFEAERSLVQIDGQSLDLAAVIAVAR